MAVAVRYLDVLVVIVAVPILLVLGAPALGTACGAGGWILQRLVQAIDKSWTSRFEEPLRRAGMRLFEAFGRIWLLAGAIVVAGVAGSRRDGLTAAIIVFCAYSVALAVRVGSGPPTERAQ